MHMIKIYIHLCFIQTSLAFVAQLLLYKRFGVDLVNAVDVRGCVDIQAQQPSRHTRGRVVTMVYYITTTCLGNYRIHARTGVCIIWQCQ